MDPWHDDVGGHLADDARRVALAVKTVVALVVVGPDVAAPCDVHADEPLQHLAAVVGYDTEPNAARAECGQSRMRPGLLPSLSSTAPTTTILPIGLRPWPPATGSFLVRKGWSSRRPRRRRPVATGPDRPSPAAACGEAATRSCRNRGSAWPGAAWPTCRSSESPASGRPETRSAAAPLTRA